MKKLYFYLAIIVAVTSLCSCDTDPLAVDENQEYEEEKDNEEDSIILIIDYASICISISIQDSTGVDLLSPESAQKFDLTNTKAYYNGKTYQLTDKKTKSITNNSTRATHVVFRGLTYSRNSSRNRYLIEFGQFMGGQTWENETVEIDWGNEFGSSVFTFSSKYIWTCSYEIPTLDRTFKLDGIEFKSALGNVTLQPGADNKLHAVE